MHACSVTNLCLTPLNLPGFPGQGIFQARLLELVAIFSSMDSSQPRDQNNISCVSCVAGRFFTLEPPGTHMWITDAYLQIYTRKNLSSSHSTSNATHGFFSSDTDQFSDSSWVSYNSILTLSTWS